MLWVLGLVLKAWLTSEMHLQKNPGSRDRSNQLAEGPHQSKVNYGKRFSLIMKNWIWWWRQNWNGATMLLIWSKNLQSVEQWQDKKGKTFLHRAKDWRMFSVEDKLGLLQEETPAVFYIRMLRETVRQRGKKMEDARKSRLEQASSSVPKVKKQTDVKGLYSLKASPATKAENSLSVAGKMKNIVVRLSTSSRVSWWQVWKQMHSWLFRHADGERKPSARSIRRYSRKTCYYQKKKKVQGCVS